ncbi:trypsin-like serine peptidase [Lacisediminihabitans sp. FW035]
MTSKNFRYGVLGALALGAGLIAGGSTGAVAAPSDSSSGVDTWFVAQQVHAQTQQVGDYWTAERMRDATPGDALVADHAAAAATGAQSRAATSGTARTVPSQAATVSPQPNAASEATVSHIGKVFFTLGGTDYVCSGNAIASSNESTVATAGHCVNEGPGAFASRWIFVPAYESGTAPYGQWTASELTAPSQWTSGGDITYDTGFATVGTLNGSTLSDTVGASAVSFNQARGLTYNAFGYPAASPFNGETLKSCSGNSSDDPNGQTESQGIACDMTGGSSGGPWFIGSGSGGSQNSINSFGYNNVQNTMFGPYWGSVIQSAYAAASS